MKWFEISPFLSIVLNVISVICYAKVKHYPWALYWVCAGCLTSIVTFWLPRWKL